MSDTILHVNRDSLQAFLDQLPYDSEFLLQVTGSSMVPFLFDKLSSVYLVKTEQYVPRVGDIVLFRRAGEGNFVLHRVHKIRKDGRIVINGDAQTWREEIAPAQIVCHVTHFVRTEKDISVDSPLYRFCRFLWRPLRPFHRLGALGCYYWRRVPYKLGLKKEAKPDGHAGHDDRMS